MKKKGYVFIILVILVLSGLLMTLIVNAEDGNLIANPSFDEGLDGWKPFSETSSIVWDNTKYYSAPASLKVEYVDERNAAQLSAPIVFTDETVTKLEVSYQGFREDAETNALVTLQLAITFNDGTKETFYPAELRLYPNEAGEWKQKSALYTAPEGKNISVVQVYLINNAVNIEGYNKSVWFDDVYLAIPEENKRIEISGLEPLMVEQTTQAIVKCFDADGSYEIIEEGITFSSSNPEVATVDVSGCVVAVGVGKTIIRAQYKQYYAEYELIVYDYDVNLVQNGSFEENLDGWVPFNATSQKERDTEMYYSAPASMKILYTTETNSFKQEPYPELPAGVTHLKAEYKGYRVNNNATRAIVTMQLKIFFDDGTTTTHYPADFWLLPDDAGKWVHKSTLYAAPEGKTIKHVQVFLLNYSRNAQEQQGVVYNTPAYFDDVKVTIANVPTSGDDETKPFTINNPIIDRESGGISVQVTVSPRAGTNGGEAVVIFKLMDGNTVKSLIGIKGNIKEAKTLTGQFFGHLGDQYSVKVYVWDKLDNSLDSTGVNLAEPVEIN